MGSDARFLSFEELFFFSRRRYSNIFYLGLVPDSSLQIRDEAERELLFQKYVSIPQDLDSSFSHTRHVHSIKILTFIRSLDQSPKASSGLYGLNSQPNICPRSLTEFSICHRTLPNHMEWTTWLTPSKTYTTRLSNSRTSPTYRNVRACSYHLGVC